MFGVNFIFGKVEGDCY